MRLIIRNILSAMVFALGLCACDSAPAVRGTAHQVVAASAPTATAITSEPSTVLLLAQIDSTGAPVMVSFGATIAHERANRDRNEGATIRIAIERNGEIVHEDEAAPLIYRAGGGFYNLQPVAIQFLDRPGAGRHMYRVLARTQSSEEIGLARSRTISLFEVRPNGS